MTGKEEIDGLFVGLSAILNNSAIERLKVLLNRLYQKTEELEKSRDNWRTKYMELKNEKSK